MSESIKKKRLSSSKGSGFKKCLLVSVVMLTAAGWASAQIIVGGPPTGRTDKQALRIALGSRLFHDDRFSSPKGDFLSSCSRCHQYDQDPKGLRAYADSLDRSWQPFRVQDPRRVAARNAPVLLDSAVMPRLHYDGEFASLEDLVKGTLAGRTMGWLPSEQREAFNYVRAVVLKDESGEGSYRAQFQAAFGVDIIGADVRQTVDLVAEAIAAYVRTLKSSRTSPYDRFIQLNGLPEKPLVKSSNGAYASELLLAVERADSRGVLKFPQGFDRQALGGMKIFFGGGAVHSGNCAVCHVPPYFTDFSFHNMGISQAGYDRVHGEGSFLRLAIPDLPANRPIENFRRSPVTDDPSVADLGYWNFADATAATSNQHPLQGMIAAFKTPTLRDLAYSDPYMHDGSYTDLQSAISVIAKMSRMAREGQVRSADIELPRIHIVGDDIPPIIAFLKTLNEDMSGRN